MTSSPLRTRPVLLLTVATLLVSLGLGVAFVTLHRAKEPRAAAIDALSDEQSRQQVLGPARQIVEAGRLREVTGSYILSACQPGDEPPYQGAARVGFDVPTIAETPAYFRRIAAAMRARGWSEGLPPNRYPGGKILTKNGVSALFYRNPDVPGRGVLEISGECRNMTDHRLDTTGFVDITADLGG